MKKLLALLLILTGCTNIMNVGKSDKTIVAHRGGAHLGPENTLICIERGLEAGADWIEIDVHLSADGEIVVCHDNSVDRTTNGKGYISEMTYGQIRGLKVLDSSGGETDQYVPLLHEVLELVRGRAVLLLEIKRTRRSLEGIEKACIDCINEYGMAEQVVIQSFDDEVLETVHELMPQMRVEKLLLAGLPFFDFDEHEYVASYNVFYRLLTDKFIEKAHENGREVKVWTLNKYDRDIVNAVDGIITNDPALFMVR